MRHLFHDLTSNHNPANRITCSFFFFMNPDLMDSEDMVAASLFGVHYVQGMESQSEETMACMIITDCRK